MVILVRVELLLVILAVINPSFGREPVPFMCMHPVRNEGSYHIRQGTTGSSTLPGGSIGPSTSSEAMTGSFEGTTRSPKPSDHGIRFSTIPEDFSEVSTHYDGIKGFSSSNYNTNGSSDSPDVTNGPSTPFATGSLASSDGTIGFSEFSDGFSTSYPPIKGTKGSTSYSDSVIASSTFPDVITDSLASPYGTKGSSLYSDVYSDSIKPSEVTAGKSESSDDTTILSTYYEGTAGISTSSDHVVSSSTSSDSTTVSSLSYDIGTITSTSADSTVQFSTNSDDTTISSTSTDAYSVSPKASHRTTVFATSTDGDPDDKIVVSTPTDTSTLSPPSSQYKVALSTSTGGSTVLPTSSDYTTVLSTSSEASTMSSTLSHRTTFSSMYTDVGTVSSSASDDTTVSSTLIDASSISSTPFRHTTFSSTSSGSTLSSTASDHTTTLSTDGTSGSFSIESTTTLPTTSGTSTHSDETSDEQADTTFSDQIREECIQYLYHFPSLPANGIFDVQNSWGTFPVYCEFHEDGGGWTVIQRRIDGSISFNLDWYAYKNGFGDLNSEFWLGLDKISSLCNARDCELLVAMKNWQGERKTAHYHGFSVEDTKLYIDSFHSGNAGNSLPVGVVVPFSTFDFDNDTNGSDCASMYGGGWWYTDCGEASPNGYYYPSHDYFHSDGIIWKSWQGGMYSLKSFEMKIRNTYNI